MPGSVWRCPEAWPTEKTPQNRPRTHLRDFISRPVSEGWGIPPEEREEAVGENRPFVITWRKNCLDSSLSDLYIMTFMFLNLTDKPVNLSTALLSHTVTQLCLCLSLHCLYSEIDFFLPGDQSMPHPRLCNPFSFSILTNQGQKAKKAHLFVLVCAINSKANWKKLWNYFCDIFHWKSNTD